jgi:hypothetical protein
MARGDFGLVLTSREVLHELYYVSMEEGVPLESYIYRLAALTALPNLKYLDTTSEIDILAVTLMKQFKLTSIFDLVITSSNQSAATESSSDGPDSLFD